METLLHAGLNNAVSATFLALVVACLSRLLARRPAVLHCLWLLVLVKLVTPPLYSVSIPWPESLASKPQEEAPATLEESRMAFQLLRVDIDALPEAAVLAEPQTEALAVTALDPAGETDLVEVTRAALGDAWGWLGPRWVPIAGSLWLAGSLIAAFISLKRIVRFQQVLRAASPGPEDIQNWVDELAANLGMRRAPAVWCISGKLSPMLWALGRCPRLIIPVELWKGLDSRQQGTLLVHELAHLKRGDHRVRVFELLVTMLYWWNPVLWWARQALRDVEEQCCDAWVVWAFPKDARSYAETLLETLDFLTQSRLSEPLLASGFGKVQHLRRRLTMIMNGTTPRLLGLRGALCALCAGALLLPVNASWAQKPDDEKEVRVVVRTDDGGEQTLVTKPGDGKEVAVFTVDDRLVEAKDFVYVVGEPAKFDTQTFKFDEQELVLAGEGAGAGAGSADGKTQVSVILKNDDSTVSVSADSVDEAIKKIQEQIKVLRAKSTPGQKDKAQQEALEKVAKELGQLAKTTQGAVLKLDTKEGGTAKARTFVYRTVEDAKNTKTLSPEKKAEIEKMRSRIKELSSELAASQKKLAELEGKNVSFRVVNVPAINANPQVHFKVAGKPDMLDVKTAPNAKMKEQQFKVMVLPKKVELQAAKEAANTATKTARSVIINRAEPKVVTGRITAAPLNKLAGSDNDRIDALEKKVDKLLNAIESLRKSKED